MKKNYFYPVLYAFLAAVLFGSSTPLAKLFLKGINPVLMASLMYLGSGIGLLFYKLIQRLLTKSFMESGLKGSDFLWLGGTIVAGGILAPIFLMTGLKNSPAATASLLLNFEGVATTMIAALVFKEAIGKRIWTAVILILLASILLSFNLSGNFGFSAGALCVIAACFFWGLDNNFTRNISAKDPITIVTIKSLAAGAFSFVLSLSIENKMPGIGVLAGAMLLGCFGYGISIVFFILALRNLGTARAGALFGIAPFVGTALSFILFSDYPGIQFFISLPVMVAGAWLLLSERHEHKHVHSGVHEHVHIHDEHHGHEHEGEFTEPHRHTHSHEKVTHSHPHRPDIHHRHGHSHADNTNSKFQDTNTKQ